MIKGERAAGNSIRASFVRNLALSQNSFNFAIRGKNLALPYEKDTENGRVRC